VDNRDLSRQLMRIASQLMKLAGEDGNLTPEEEASGLELAREFGERVDGDKLAREFREVANRLNLNKGHELKKDLDTLGMQESHARDMIAKTLDYIAWVGSSRTTGFAPLLPFQVDLINLVEKHSESFPGDWPRLKEYKDAGWVDKAKGQ